MVCVYCGAKTHIVNSRLQHRANSVWRRRKCWDCGAIFTTGEETHYGAIWAVQTPEGKLEPFSRDKLLLSLYKSCQHRPAALADAGALAETIIKKLRDLANEGVLGSRAIVQVAQVALNRFDRAASVHYQANHRG